MDAGGCRAVPARGVPRASSTPRPCGRQLSTGPLLTSVPDGLPAVNRVRTSLQTSERGPLPSQDEASTLACGARTGWARRTPDSVPAEDHSAGDERGLTARPSPLDANPVVHKRLSTTRRNRSIALPFRDRSLGDFDAARERAVRVGDVDPIGVEPLLDGLDVLGAGLHEVRSRGIGDPDAGL